MHMIHMIQVACQGQPLRKDFYFSVVVPVVAGLVSTYSKERTQRHTFRMQRCAQRMSVHLRQLARKLMPAHLLERIARQPAAACKEACSEARPQVVQMFADLQGFTAMSATMEPEHVFTLLSHMWDLLDAACERRAVTKIETIGDGIHIRLFSLVDVCVTSKFARAHMYICMCMYVKFSLV